MVNLLNLLFLHLANLNLMLHAHLISQETKDEIENHRNCDGIQAISPPRQPGSGKNADLQGSLRISPHTILVRSLQAEQVSARRQVIISGKMALGIHHDFFIIIAFQTIGIHVLLRIHIIQERKLDSKVIILILKCDSVCIVHVFL